MNIVELSRRISQERRRRGWTQEELAKQAGISQAIVSFVESGKPRKYKDINKILTALDIDETLDFVKTRKVTTLKDVEDTIHSYVGLSAMSKKLLIDFARELDELDYLRGIARQAKP